MTWLLPVLILFAWLSGVLFISAAVEARRGKAVQVIIYTVWSIMLLVLATYIAIAINTKDLGALAPPEVRYEYPVDK